MHPLYVRLHESATRRGHLLLARGLGRPHLTTRPVLLMGTARSGTSFVGDALARANEAVYLREPITHEMFRRFSEAPLVTRLHEDPPPAPLLRIADASFSGRVPLTPQVVTRPADSRDPKATTLVVKEVQPLASAWLVRRYAARFVALFRHPAAIAASWWGRGWGPAVHEPIFTRRFRRDGIGDAPSERLGAIIAVHERAMLDVLTELGVDATQLRYEDVATQPIMTLRHLYDHLDLGWRPEIESAIMDATAGHRPPGTPRRLVRRAATRTDAWRESLSADTVSGLRRGYECAGGRVYLDQW